MTASAKRVARTALAIAVLLLPGCVVFSCHV